MSADSARTSLFFSNVPAGTPLSTIRQLFERTGRVVGCRFLEQARRKPDDDTLSGFIDMADRLSAEAALRALAGYLLPGDVKLVVKMGERNKKRERERDAAADATGEYVASNLVAGGDPVQLALKQMPQEELTEAVAQLRVLAADHPDVVRALLHDNPQLRYAVTLVLQKEGALPINLPPEAFGLAPATAQADADAGAAAQPSDAAIAAVQELDTAELAKLLALTPAEIAALPPAERTVVETLQPQLKAMMGQ